MDDKEQELRKVKDKVAKMTIEEACKRSDELKRFGEPMSADLAVESPDDLFLMYEYQLTREKCANKNEPNSK